MSVAANFLDGKKPNVVGSFGTADSLKNQTFTGLSDACDLVEIRLDLLALDGAKTDPSTWHHLKPFPLLFTARRQEEGGALPLTAQSRAQMLHSCLEDAALIDIEVASISEMAPIIDSLKEKNIPWVASFHDFEKLPSRATLDTAMETARSAGAAVFKIAAKLAGPQDLAALADFQLTDHGILVSSMGMGPLAPVSRQLLAQCGSILNYGYLGSMPTAPGQWDSALLKTAISRLAPFNR